MSGVDFQDEFDINNVPEKPATPIEYIKLDDSTLIERDLDSFPDQLKEQAISRYNLIAFIDKQLTGGWTQKNLEPIIDSFFADKTEAKPGWRSVVRWHKKYVDSNGSIASLVARHHRMGNRTKRVEGDELYFERALVRFLDAKRPSITAAYQYYKDLITIENESIIEGKISIISYRSFNKRIKSLPPYPLAVARHGKFMADQWFAYCASHTPPTRILQRVEIDHTPLDLILLDDELQIPIGRPYLTLLIDVFSGCVLGYHLSYKAPSYISAAKAITQAIKPKSLNNELDVELQNDWPCHGKIETLVVDNGAEFWSASLEHACREAGINIQYNPVRKPWLKPFIERFFGTINQLFLKDFPGKTFSNILDKEEYKPEKYAVMRFSTFVEEFQRWIVDVYHQESNSRETRIPIKRWQQGFEALPPLDMNEAEELRFEMIMGVKFKRTLSRNGIKLEDLMYDSTALADYRKRYPQSKASSKKVIKVDPDDLSSIHVYLEELESYLKVPCTDTTGYVRNLGLYKHRVIKKYRREQTRNQRNDLGLAKARMAIDERVQQEQKLLETSNKQKLKSIKKQAQFSDVSNTGQGSIKVSGPAAESKAREDESSEKNGFLDSWDDIPDDLEGF